VAVTWRAWVRGIPATLRERVRAPDAAEARRRLALAWGVQVEDVEAVPVIGSIEVGRSYREVWTTTVGPPR
jgi:hypothetical protein